MRKHTSVNSSSPHYVPGLKARVFLNGRDISNRCFEAKEGWVFGFAKCHILDHSGRVILNDPRDGLLSETLRGNVRIAIQ